MAESIHNMDTSEINSANKLIHEGYNDVILPEEKEFHLFLSHSSKDEVQVIPILEALEAPPYNLKCCIDRRDFTLGETIMDNINFALSKSVATVLFLTPNFIDSDYCSHEKQTAYSLFMEGQARIIPVILQPCHLPDELRTIHYIDEATTGEIVVKIHKCLTTDPGDFKKLLPLKSFIAGEARLNGKRFECLNSTDSALAQQRREFIRRGIKVDSDLENLLQMLYCQSLWQDKWPKRSLILFPLLYAAVFGFLLTMVAVLVVVFMLQQCSWECVINENWEYDYLAIVITGISPAAIFICFWPAFAVIVICRRKYRIWKTHSNIRKICQLSVPDVKCAFHMDVSLYKEARFTAMKYDITQCKEYLIDQYCDSSLMTQSSQEIWWQDIVHNDAFSNYFQHLGRDTLDFVKEIRHLVANDKICFCQFYESLRKVKGDAQLNGETSGQILDSTHEVEPCYHSCENHTEEPCDTTDTTALISNDRNYIV